MPNPTVIALLGRRADVSAVSAMLRTVLEGERPYESVGVVGSYELFDGREWGRGPDAAAELGRAGEHLAHARESGLAHLVLEVVDGNGARGVGDGAGGNENSVRGGGEKNPGGVAPDVRCALGPDGSGSAEGLGRRLSFSLTGPRADVGATRLQAGFGFLQFRAHTPSWSGNVAMPLVGRHNAAAALAAISVLELMGVGRDRVCAGLCVARVPGHTELLYSPDQRVLALLEGDADRACRRRTLEAARREFPGFAIETPVGSGVDLEVRRAYEREGRTLLVLLGPAEASADAFQAAVRRHSGWRGKP